VRCSAVLCLLITGARRYRNSIAAMQHDCSTLQLLLLAVSALNGVAALDTALAALVDSIQHLHAVPVKGRSQDDGPFGRTTSCALECPSSRTFEYQDNMVHVYDYHSSARVFGGLEEPQLSVTARVHITVAGPCEMILALSHVRLRGTSAPSTDFAAALTSTPLRFAFHDGRISVICPATEEPLWVLNFKRAVLSTFQNSMTTLGTSNPPKLRINETDVSGTCESTYTALKDTNGDYNVTRIRSENCVSRAVPPTNCKLSALLQLLPVFNNQQTCYQKVSEGILRESTCREDIRYPEMLDSVERLPIITVVTSLTLSYQFKADFVVIPNYNATRATLQHDWEIENLQPPTEWLQYVQDMLKAFEFVTPSPTLFYDLVELLRTLDYDQIRQLFVDTVPDYWNTAAMSFMSVGTESAMKILVDFMKSDVITSSKLGDIVDYLTLRFDVNDPMIDLLKSVIKNRPSDNSALTKVNNYCSAKSNCENDSRISDIYAAVEKYVKPKCSAPARQARELDMEAGDFVQVKVIPINSFNNSIENSYQNTEYLNVNYPINSYEYSIENSYQNTEYLNVLRDVGHWSPELSTALDTCVRSNISEETYNALEAISRAPCSLYNYNDLLKVWLDPKLDCFTQIIMFKTLARCPTPEFKSSVTNKLLQEEVTHVTSYIFSYLQNYNEPWTNAASRESRFSTKYRTENMKFSRYFRKDFVISNKTFTIHADIFFSGLSPVPQYKSFMVTSNDVHPNNIFDVVWRQKNVTKKNYDTPDETDTVTSTYNVCTLKIFGYTFYDRERNVRSKYNYWSANDIYSGIISVGYRIVAKMSIEYLYQYFSRISDVSYAKAFDVKLRYPTSMGLPIKVQMNMTTGSHEGTLLLSYAKNIDVKLSLDATHTEIGCKLSAKCEFFPKIKASFESKNVQFKFNLPKERNELFNIEYASYTFEDEKLTPKFFENETSLNSLCIPKLRETTGFNVCFDYYPRMRYWPIYIMKYGVSYTRDADLEGMTIRYKYNDRLNLDEVALETVGSPSSTWKLTKYRMAQFVNIDIVSPYFSLNGSGTYKDDVLFFREMGQAVNISGLFRFDGKEAPFQLISEMGFEPDTMRNSITVNFESTLLETKIATSYNMGPDTTFILSIPYKFADGATDKSFKLSAVKRVVSLTSDRRKNYVTPQPTTFERRVYGLTVGTSQYMEPMLSVEAVCERGEGINTHVVDFSIGKGGEHSCGAQVSYVKTYDFCDMNCTGYYEKPDVWIVFQKQSHIANYSSSTQTTMDYNNKTLFSLNGQYENKTNEIICSNASFVVPNHDIDARHSIFQVNYDQLFNFTGQNFYVRLNTSMDDRTLALDTYSSKVASVKRSQYHIPGLQRSDQINSYIGGMEVTSPWSDEAYGITLESQKTKPTVAAQPTFDMNVYVKLPVRGWNEEPFELNIHKIKNKMKATMLDKRYSKEKLSYIDGEVDYDIITNSIDYLHEGFGQPEVKVTAQ